MRLNICPRNYEYKKWFAWYPIYWGYGKTRVWLEIVYRKWDVFDGTWKVLTKEQYERIFLYKPLKDEWDTSTQNDKGNNPENTPKYYYLKSEK